MSTAERHVVAPLRYLVAGSPRPVSHMADVAGGAEVERTGEYAPYEVAIRDARTLDPAPCLAREGFELRTHRSAVRDFYDDEEVERVYYPEMAALLAEATGATRVHVFDHNTRAEGEPRAAHPNAHGPVNLVHNDFTFASAPRRVQRVLPEEAQALLPYRFCIVNLWRAIRGPLQSSPLALCDAQSVRPEHVVAADLVYRDRVGEEYRCLYRAEHRWAYFPRLMPEEVALLKVFDAAEDGTARFCFHTAFTDPGAPPDALPRESIEVRAMAFFLPG